MSSTQCAQCGLVIWSSAVECKRCGFVRTVQDARNALAQNYESLAPEPTPLFSGGVKVLTGVLVLEMVPILLSSLHVIGDHTASMIGVFFMLSGIALLVVTHIWLVIRIFEQSAWWGLGTLFIPFVGLLAVVQFWQKTKRSFIGRLICIGIVLASILILPD
jgi:hypothetical protein